VLISTSKLLEPRLLIQATDLDGIATRQEANDFKVFDDRESYHVIRVPRRMATVTVTLSGKIKVASKGTDEEFTTSETFQINASQKTDKVDDIHLGRDAAGYWLEVAGRTGETRADRAAEIVLKHHDFREPVRASLKSDGRGIIKLGPLPGIDRIEATLSNGATRAWPLMADRATQHKVLHVVAGQDVSVPLMTGAIAPQRSEAALFEVRENVIVADRFDRLSTVNGMLVARKLMAGDYDLVLKAQNEVIRIRVVAGPVLEGMVLGSLRDMSLAPVAPLQVAGITRNDAGLTVSLAGTTPMTRVHVLANAMGSPIRLTEGGYIVGDIDDRHLQDEGAVVLSFAVNEVLAVEHVWSINCDERDIEQVLAWWLLRACDGRKVWNLPARRGNHFLNAGASVLGKLCSAWEAVSELVK
jgi:hypothetical protein